jgi:NAD(P)-dependent dehydrogenase (short-subunit alcohol dehydrogenase family)
MVKVAITGGTSGVAYEACKQLCSVAEVSGIVITSRTSANAEAAIEKLKAATGKADSFFEYVVLDLEELSSIVAAISAFPKVDRICLNGSQLGKCKLNGQSMVTDAMTSVLGHTILTDGLMAAGRLNAGARIVHVGGEIARPLWGFTGLLPNYWSFTEGDLDAAISKNYSDCCCCLPIRMQLGDYKNTKIVGPLFYAGLAAEQSEVHVMSVSPGAMTGTGMFDRGFFPAPIIKHLGCLFDCLQITHPVSEGAKRYVAVLTDEPPFPAGAYAMSGRPPPCCCCLWGAKGPLVDNRQYGGGCECCGPRYLDQPALNKATLAKMRGCQARWFENVAASASSPQVPKLPEQMERWKTMH